MGNSSISFEQKIWRLININVFVLKNQCKADDNPGILFYLSTSTKEILNKNEYFITFFHPNVSLTFSKTNVINANTYFFFDQEDQTKTD